MIVYCFEFPDSDYENVDPYSFKALLGNVDLTDNNEFLDGKDLLDKMVQGSTTTTAPYPTRTPGPSTTEDPNSNNGNGNGAASTTTESTYGGSVTTDDGKTIVELANEHLALKSIMSTMLDASTVSGIKNPKETSIRYPLSILASKLMEGDDPDNKERWDAVAQVYPEDEGVSQTVRELQNYMLAWLGAANVSYEDTAPYYNPEKGEVNYAEQGDGFGMSHNSDL